MKVRILIDSPERNKKMSIPDLENRRCSIRGVPPFLKITHILDSGQGGNRDENFEIAS